MIVVILNFLYHLQTLQYRWPQPFLPRLHFLERNIKNLYFQTWTLKDYKFFLKMQDPSLIYLSEEGRVSQFIDPIFGLFSSSATRRSQQKEQRWGFSGRVDSILVVLWVAKESSFGWGPLSSAFHKPEGLLDT